MSSSDAKETQENGNSVSSQYKNKMTHLYTTVDFAWDGGGVKTGILLAES